MAESAGGFLATTLKLILALAIVGGGTGGYLTWNFQQQEEFRPFEGYTNAGLQDLASAYEGPFDKLDGRYQALSGREVQVQHHALLGDRVNEFERVQRIADQTRKAGHEVSYVMADQKNLERELWIRAHQIQHFWDTATRF